MPVLCYHAIDPAWRSPLAISPDAFARQCAWISRHRRVVSLGEVVDRMNGAVRLPRGVVRVLAAMDRFLAGWPLLRGMADHRLVILVRK